MRGTVFENILITDAGAEGKAVARINNQVVFVPFVVPGDVVDIKVLKKKKSFFEGVAVRIREYSPRRTEAFCEHFGTCGGCRWQNMNYNDQLFFKQKQVEEQFKRIGHIEDIEIIPILASDKIKYYRNKLEYSFSNHRWLTEADMHGEEQGGPERNALGYHIPGLYDKILDIRNCYLQPAPSNEIRLAAKEYAFEKGLSFYDVRKWTGFLRNLLIRNTEAGDLMVIMVFREDDQEKIVPFMDNLALLFPAITSMYYVINEKHNDVINDLPFIHYKGKPYITEKMLSLKGDKTIEYRIGPGSFFQTNSGQASRLYRIAGEFAGFKGNETVYDLYTGTGTIASFISSSVKKVVGIEYVASAIEDAAVNAEVNGITNTYFHAGEAEKILNQQFFRDNGKPDVIITDPPRAGMHEKVVRAIMDSGAEKVIYISCNPATQARDIAIMKDVFKAVKCQPVDMFPHTHHVENVTLLIRI